MTPPELPYTRRVGLLIQRETQTPLESPFWIRARWVYEIQTRAFFLFELRTWDF